MHISIFVYGTWGDIRPHVVLGQALQALGHEVQVIASPGYEQWVRDRGLGYYPLTADVNTFAKENAHIMDQGFRQQLRTAKEVLEPKFLQMGLEALEATRESDVLMTVEFSVGLLIDVLQVNNLKTILINPAPLNPTREFTSAMPPAPSWLPAKGRYNRFTYDMVRRITWSVLGGARNEISTKHLGLPKRNFKEYRALLAKIPALTSVSKHVVQRPADWADHFQVTGYLIDDDLEWTPPQDLADFLQAGEPPVYIGFGSMPDSKPVATTQLLLEGIQQTGKRAIILKGWAGLRAGAIPENVYILDYAPHTWLFPKMAAVIHHGGSGTTASGLRAGVPTTIVPFNADQPYWGRRVQALGVGTAQIPRKQLTADKLATAIMELTTNNKLRANAQALGAKIEQEDSVSETVKWVEHYLSHGT